VDPRSLAGSGVVCAPMSAGARDSGEIAGSHAFRHTDRLKSVLAQGI